MTIIKAIGWDLLRLALLSMPLLCAGCSSISKFSLLEQASTGEWAASGAGYSYRNVRLSTPTYGVQMDSLDILAAAGPRAGVPLFLGPLLVPVIPDLLLLLPGSSHDQRFSFDLRIQNRSRSARELYPSRIGFRSNGATIEPERVIALYHGCFGQREGAYGCDDYRAESIGDTLALQPFNTLLIRYCFREWHAEVKGLDVSVDGALVPGPVPPLMLRKKNKVKYLPFIFPRFSHFDR